MPIYRVWDTINEEQPICYVDAPNDGRAIIHAVLHETSETWYDEGSHGLRSMMAEEFDLAGKPFSYQSLVELGRAIPACPICNERLFHPVAVDDYQFCDETCANLYLSEGTKTFSKDVVDSMICLYTDY